MTLDEARKRIITAIGSIYEQDEAKNIAELLMEHITNLPAIERIVKKHDLLREKEEKFLEQSIKRLQNHEPIQYITNEAWFAGMKFYVDKNVLIPRPETEELVEWVAKEVGSQKSDIRILDVGTGSGCIAIALKNRMPHAEIWACDVSDEALNVARMNADSLHAAIDFVPLNFLSVDQRRQLPHVDVIVSNPPYVLQKEKTAMRKNVTEYEPFAALFVPDNDPLTFYEAIAEFGKEKLNTPGSIFVEIHEDLAKEVKNLFLGKYYNSVEVRRDLQEKERMVKAVLHAPAG
jgi:release factor glutamine methyltransferase